MADTSTDEILQLQALHETHVRRRRFLEMQCAHYGSGLAPAHLLVELEDETKHIAKTEAELRRLRRQLGLSPVDDRNPYLGLLTFQEADVDRFFGRDALVADLIKRAGRAPFLAVLGPSGSGKSSVVHAGLITALKEGALLGSDRWCYITLRPGARPLEKLAAELAAAQGNDLTNVIALSSALENGNRSLLQVAERLLVGKDGARLVLVVDQGEELWAPPDDPEQRATFDNQRRAFIQCLITAIEEPDSPLLTILTMRADFLHRAAEHQKLARLIAEHDVIVSPMTEEELREAIERPAETVGGSFEPGLVDELIEEVVDQAGRLPLLEYTLLELWNRRIADTMTWKAYRSLGGVAGAIAARADEILKRQSPPQQDELGAVLLRLVQVGEGVPDTRRRRQLEELVPADGSVERVRSLLKPLVDARLIITGDKTPGVETIEVAHEALIHAWGTFKNWIDAARNDLRLLDKVEKAAKDWINNEKNKDFVWTGQQLAEAEALLKRAQPQLNEREVDFLDACRAHNNDLILSRYWGQAAGGAVGAALGYSLAFAIGYWSTQSDLSLAYRQRQTAVTFLLMFPIGTLAGLSIGIGLLLSWKIGRALPIDTSQGFRFRLRQLVANERAYRMPITGLLGAVTGSIAYSLFIAGLLDPAIRPEHIATGLLLGAGLGIGAGVPADKGLRLLATTLGGLISLGLAVLVGGLQWSLPATLLAGLVLGLTTGVGFWRTAVENDNL